MLWAGGRAQPTAGVMASESTSLVTTDDVVVESVASTQVRLGTEAVKALRAFLDPSSRSITSTRPQTSLRSNKSCRCRVGP
jgi:hypothetical protein